MYGGYYWLNVITSGILYNVSPKQKREHKPVVFFVVFFWVFLTAKLRLKHLFVVCDSPSIPADVLDHVLYLRIQQ